MKLERGRVRFPKLWYVRRGHGAAGGDGVVVWFRFGLRFRTYFHPFPCIDGAIFLCETAYLTRSNLTLTVRL